jgi:NADPH-dependent 2,4-dienoyl-CoA reductase/sulfur reductase-like enzyme
MQPDWRITIISGESQYHYSRPALMYIYMGHMTYQSTKPYEDDFWPRNRIDLLRAWVTEIDTDRSRLILHKQEPLEYDKLLIATGSKSNKFGWPGQDLDGVQGFYSLQDLRNLYETTERTSHAVIVGGGLIGIELAEMLHSRNIHVTFLVREASYWNNIMPKEESAMLNRIIREQGLDLKLNTSLVEIEDNGKGKVCAVRTDPEERIECQMVGLTAGVSPNIELVKDSPIETGRGVLVSEQLQTNIPNIYSAGDCAEIKTDGERNLIQQVWYTGKRQGKLAGEVMAGETSSYTPGIWYNSAKFLDLEYQVYGQVNLKIPGEKNLFWEHANHKHAIRVVYTDEGVIGMNLMGLRYRHEVCESWIADKRSVNDVLDNLSEANFDPEFFQTHEAEIVPALREQIT